MTSVMRLTAHRMGVRTFPSRCQRWGVARGQGQPFWRRPGLPALACICLLALCSRPGLCAQDVKLIDLSADLEPICKQAAMPALGAAVICEGRLCAAGVAGVRKYGSDVKAELGDPFHLGSCTKAMTGSLIGLLVERGKLRWDMTLEEAFPEFKDEMHPDYRAVTLTHLLSHRAGLPPMTAGFDPISGEQLKEILAMPSPAAQRRHVAEIVLSYPPVRKPGQEMLYSNAGYALAGAIAEKAAGEDYERLIMRMLFEPLGMASAGFGAMGTRGRIDAPWQHTKSGDTITPIEPGPDSDNPPFLTPGGRVHCSICDWAKYVQCILKALRGEEGLLPAAQVRQLKEPPFGGDYALGWTICQRDWAHGRAFTHAGTNKQNYCIVWIAPARNFAVLVATNRGGEDAFGPLDKLCAQMIARFLKDAR